MATGPDDTRWAEFEQLGEVEVRKRIVARVWSREKQELAEHWLRFQECTDSSASRRETLRLANEANDLARSANKAASEANVIAQRSAAAAWASSIIAAAALIAAITAIVFSTIGKHWFS